MSNAIEIEAKALINHDQYNKLIDLFPQYMSYTQTNYYVDNDEGLMRKEGLALRIREKGGTFEMTLKTPLSEGLLEKNCTWSHNTFVSFRDHGIFPEGDIKRFLTMLDIDVTKLKIKTSLTTKRTDVPYEGGKLSIDENTYCGQIDYEVELEYNNEMDAERLLRELLEENGIPFFLNKKTKVARALDAYAKMK
ncbi:MAG: CYTH domain-containing protein [Bacilli bacterium]|nr:CYTH domain-containing protein [Bacilli bacterium]